VLLLLLLLLLLLPCAGCAADGARRSVSTQVSFDPPPWELFTTSCPSPSATRVSPPGSTHTSWPSFTAKGRRSTCRGRNAPSVYVGTVESWTTGCATQPRGSATRRERSRSSSAGVASGPTTIPLPPEPSTGLTTSSARRSITSASAPGSSRRQVSTFFSTGSSPR
jgi:hypothetical protein